MRDVSGRFAAPFVMPSGRRERVLLTLEHLLGADSFLQMRGLGVRLDTFTRAEVAERICDALAFLHRHAIVASDIAPRTTFWSPSAPATKPRCALIDCDSMVFLGRQALTSVQTADWEIPAAFGESPNTRAADAYKIGIVVLRLFARSHDARAVGPHVRHVPAELHGFSCGRWPTTRSIARRRGRVAASLARVARGGAAERTVSRAGAGAADCRSRGAAGHAGCPAGCCAECWLVPGAATGPRTAGAVRAGLSTICTGRRRGGITVRRSRCPGGATGPAHRVGVAPASGCGGVDRCRDGRPAAPVLAAVRGGDPAATGWERRRRLDVRSGRDQPDQYQGYPRDREVLPAISEWSAAPTAPYPAFGQVPDRAWPASYHAYGNCRPGHTLPDATKCASSLADGLPNPAAGDRRRIRVVTPAGSASRSAELVLLPVRGGPPRRFVTRRRRTADDLTGARVRRHGRRRRTGSRSSARCRRGRSRRRSRSAVATFSAFPCR